MPFPPASVVLDPASGRQGTDQVVIVRGAGTAFTTGACSARFGGAEAEVALVQVETDDRIRLLVSIPPDAPEGTATLELETPSGSFSPSFSILPASADVSAHFVPDVVVAGWAGVIRVDGRGTRFEAGVTRVSFEEGAGLLTTALQVVGPTRLHLLLDVPATTPARVYGATISTGSQVLGTTLRVQSDEVPSLEVRPPSALQGARVAAEVSTHGFALGETPVVEFPSNDGVTVVEPPGVVLHSAPTDPHGRLAVELAVAADAPIGFTTLRVRTADDREVVGAFTVLRADDTPTCTFLSTVRAGERLAALQVVGRYTEFRFGGTTAESDSPDVAIDDVVVASRTTAIVVASVAADAPPGPVDVTLRWGPDDSVTCPLTVEPAPAAALTVTPDTLEHPVGDVDEERTLELAVVGLDLTSATPRLASEPGSGIAVRSLSVEGPTTATAVVRMARDAPFGPSTLTLTLDPLAVSTVVRVTRAAGDAPELVPDYVLLDGADHDLAFRSTDPPLLDGTAPWFEALRTDTAELALALAGPATATEQPLTIRPALPATAGHRTIAAHGVDAADDTARHLAVRLTGVPVGGRWGEASPGTLRTGRQYSVLVTVTPEELTGETVVAAPRDAGLEPRSLLVVGPGSAYLGLGVDQTAPAGDHVLVLRTSTASFPVVVETALPDEAPYAVTTTTVPSGTSQELGLTGFRTAWSAVTTAEATAGDPDLTLGGLTVDGVATARLRVTAAAAPLRAGGHVVRLRTGYAVAPALVWLDSPVLDLSLAPGWLHAGREATVTLSGSAIGPAAAVGPDEGLDEATVTARAAGSLTLTLRAAEATTGIAVLALDADGSGSFVPLVLPVLPAPPAALPASLSLPRAPGSHTVTARLSGLDVAAGIGVRAAGAGLWTGDARPGALPDELLVEATIDLDASPGDRRWLVFLAETDAAALRLLPGGDRPRELTPGLDEVVNPAPGLPALRRLSAASAGLAAVRATCDDPTAATLSVVGGDGATVLVRTTGDRPLPQALPIFGDGAAFLVVEAERPVACTVRQLSWVESEPARHDLEPNDDPDDAERLTPAGGPAQRQLGVLADGYDIDRYRVELPGPACIEAFAAQPAGYAPRAELALEVTAPDGRVLAADPWSSDADDAATICVATAGTWLVAVRAVAGADGPYVLSLRPSVVLAELDLWSGGTRFLELAAPAGMSLDGWHVVQRSGAGATVADFTLTGSVPADGLLVVAADAALGAADAVWPALDAAAAPVAFAVVAPGGADVDLLGLAGAAGEGGRLEPPSAAEHPASLGRCLRVDTDDNADDFWRQRAPSPGAANTCEYR